MLTNTIPWSTKPGARSCLLYSAQYSQETENGASNRFILAGGYSLFKIGSGETNAVKLFSTITGKVAGSVTNLHNSVFSTAINHNAKRIAVGGGGKICMIFDLDESVESLRTAEKNRENSIIAV
jgi:hypothetical protein